MNFFFYIIFGQIPKCSFKGIFPTWKNCFFFLYHWLWLSITFFHYSWIWFKMETIMIVIHVLFFLHSVSFWSIIFCVYMCNIHFIKYLFFILFCYLFETTKKQLCFPLTILSYVPYSFTSFFLFFTIFISCQNKISIKCFQKCVLFRKTLHCIASLKLW